MASPSQKNLQGALGYSEYLIPLRLRNQMMKRLGSVKKEPLEEEVKGGEEDRGRRGWRRTADGVVAVEKTKLNGNTKGRPSMSFMSE
ncbi:hypothetical protein Tsubulata_035067 [Turnera subulata]|uniref:Uncharacterized protein n=1 Tax=Turnera subulata TaxID=218843 RepID=A0A9Q0GG26_9ROSI|nr:hypothetical protein Tsubulata_035067 [Turnera subulata]